MPPPATPSRRPAHSASSTLSKTSLETRPPSAFRDACVCIGRVTVALLFGVVAGGLLATVAQAQAPVESDTLRRIKALTVAPAAFHLFFEKDQMNVGADHQSILTDIVSRIPGFDGYVLIESFADADGPKQLNLEVSERRAKVVEGALRGLIDGKTVSIKSVAHGSRYARATNEAERRYDRVVTVSLIERRVAEAVNVALKAAKAIMGGDRVTIGTAATGFIAPPEPGAVDEPATLVSVPTSSNPPQAPATLPPGLTMTAVQDDPSPFNMRVFYLHAASAPATYNKLVYSGPSETGIAPAEYASTSPGTPSALGVGIEGQGPSGTWSALAIGARFRRYAAFKGRSTFVGSGAEHDLVAETTADAVGLWVDAYPLRHGLSSRLMAKAGVGFDYDYSTVRLAEVYTDDRVEGDEATSETTVESSLGVASLRLVSRLDYQWTHLAIGANINFQLPLGELNRTIKAAGDAEAWNETIGHRASVGSEIALGLVYRL